VLSDRCTHNVAWIPQWIHNTVNFIPFVFASKSTVVCPNVQEKDQFLGFIGHSVIYIHMVTFTVTTIRTSKLKIIFFWWIYFIITFQMNQYILVICFITLYCHLAKWLVDFKKSFTTQWSCPWCLCLLPI
jgi:hypothetical protein